MNGWIFIDKQKNITSFKVIQRLRKILNIKKIGHAGTLDPFATGILAIAVGEATKSIHYFNQNKVYKFNVVFGEQKDTDDITGKTTNRSNIIPNKNKGFDKIYIRREDANYRVILNEADLIEKLKSLN